MKLKEAIKILQDFQNVAGEDARCDLGELRLVSSVDVKYHDYGYSYRQEEKSRNVVYHVTAYREADAQPAQYQYVGSGLDLGQIRCGEAQQASS